MTVLQVDPNTVGPGLLAFVIVVLLAVATWLLVLSMRKQIRKVPPTFDPDGPPARRIDPPSDRQSE